MYLILKCPGCSTFTYVDKYSPQRLCPQCGEIIDVAGATIYLEVDDYRLAESIIAELKKYLTAQKRKDLTEEEREQIRKEYAEWMKQTLLSPEKSNASKKMTNIIES
ncbi:MAG: DUF1922 domain-containing protein [Methanomicrobium sp.]|nr:DUF1922 domain-containing protein [Methanomicrobium sp.]